MCQKEEEKSASELAAKKQTTVASQTQAATNSRYSNSVLIYDGDCAFCTTASVWARDRSQTLSIAAWQQTNLETYNLTEEEASMKVQFWDAQKQVVLSGSDAVCSTLATSDNLIWRTIGHIGLVPPLRWFGIALYPVAARFRHRLPGSEEACRLK